MKYFQGHHINGIIVELGFNPLFGHLDFLARFFFSFKFFLLKYIITFVALNIHINCHGLLWYELGTR